MKEQVTKLDEMEQSYQDKLFEAQSAQQEAEAKVEGLEDEISRLKSIISDLEAKVAQLEEECDTKYNQGYEAGVESLEMDKVRAEAKHVGQMGMLKTIGGKIDKTLWAHGKYHDFIDDAEPL